jgi:hypothetical protein
MTTNTITHQITVRAALFGNDENSVAAITRALSEGGVVEGAEQAIRGMSTGGRSIVVRELATVTNGLLALDLGDVLIGAWRRRTALIDAARRTSLMPESSAAVDLAAHRVTQTQQPYIDLLVNGKRLHRFDLELSLVLDVHALVAVVRGGKLVELSSGSCDLLCSLTVDRYRVAERMANLDLPLVVRLGSGIPLLPDEGPTIPSQARQRSSQVK